MAFIMPLTVVQSKGICTLDRVYNVEFDVGGPKCSGLRSDIQLVQALLNIRFSTKGDVRCIKTGRMLTRLYVDGIYGPATANAILSYQKHCATGPNVSQFIDGIVSRANPTGWSTRSDTIYTIIHLNAYLVVFNDGQLPDLDIFGGIEPLTSNLKSSASKQGIA